MSYVLVSADFPDVTSEERKIIYSNLEKIFWKKVRGNERDISTTWHRNMSNLNEQSSIDCAILEFQNASSKYTKCKLAVQAGPLSHKTVD